MALPPREITHGTCVPFASAIGDCGKQCGYFNEPCHDCKLGGHSKSSITALRSRLGSFRRSAEMRATSSLPLQPLISRRSIAFGARYRSIAPMIQISLTSLCSDQEQSPKIVPPFLMPNSTNNKENKLDWQIKRETKLDEPLFDALQKAASATFVPQRWTVIALRLLYIYRSNLLQY